MRATPGHIFWTVLLTIFFRSPCSQNAGTPPQAAPPLEFVSAWGVRGDGPGQLSNPAALAADGAGNVYTVEPASGFMNKFSPAGEPRLSFQDEDRDLQPTSIAADDGGGIYVADGGSGSVIIYSPDGERFKELHTGATEAVQSSLRIAVDTNGTIYLAGKRPFGVRKYNRRGKFLGSWGTPAFKDAAIDEPGGIACGSDGLVYVSEAQLGIIRVYRRTGELLRTFKPLDAGAMLGGVAVNGKYVIGADSRNHLVYIWGMVGGYLLRGDLRSWIPGNAPSPQGVAVTPSGELLVLDAPGARVLRFRLHL